MPRLFSIVCIILSYCFVTNVQAQTLLQNNGFQEVTVFQGKIVFLREIPLTGDSQQTSFLRLKNWCKENYARDPLISNIRYDNNNKEVVIKSKIELLLVPNNQNIREKVTMTYHLNTFIINNRCVFEFKDISYTYPNNRKKINAELVITDQGLISKNKDHVINAKIKQSTLYFFNELTDNITLAINKQ